MGHMCNSPLKIDTTFPLILPKVGVEPKMELSGMK